MKSIGIYFDKFKNSAINEIKKRNAISEIIRSETGITIPAESVKVSGNIIKLKLNQTEKSQIFIKKQRIIKRILDSVPNLIIKDIN